MLLMEYSSGQNENKGILTVRKHRQLRSEEMTEMANYERPKTENS